MNEEVTPRVPQGPQTPNVEGNMSNVKINDGFRNLIQLLMNQAQVITYHVASQAKIRVRPQVNPNASTSASRIWYFLMMNPLTFHGSKKDEDSQGFLN